jgi:transcriptional regulator with XRE-family HTH domain
MSSIKEAAAAQKKSQKELALAADVSLPTIKRWLAGRGVSLEQMEKLATLLGLSLTEIATSVEQVPPHFTYSREQEEYFAAKPAYLAFFDHLLRGHSPAQIAKRHGLSKSVTQRLLSRLDRMGLVEWLPEDRVRLRVTGEPRWMVNGPLARKYTPLIREAFLRTPGTERFVLQDYLPEDTRELERKMDELLSLARRAHTRARANSESARPFGLFLSLKSYRWSLDSELG